MDDAPAGVADGVARALALSKYVRRWVAAQHRGDAAAAERALAGLAAAPWTHARLQAAIDHELAALHATAGADDYPNLLAAALRRVRRQTVLAVIARDLGGVAPLAEVVGTMTALAEVAVQRALAAHAHVLAGRHGVPVSADGVPQDLLVVAMGKGGGVELNVSSDLDLVFVYDEDGTTAARDAYADARRPLSNHEFFEQLGRRLNVALADTDADGFVFRVDLRLRPNGDSGPLVVSTAMLEEYLIRQGREWERFAWLKGRVISAPVFAGPAAFRAQVRALERLVQPFVFRKYLDFNAIAALRELHVQIRAETERRNAKRRTPQDNVKLGRGGIREIEFIAQTFQVIRGGREPRLRSRSTLATLATLAQNGALPADTADGLAAAYDFLRRLEHALQYVDDAQTHLMPAAADELAVVAQMMRLASADELQRAYATWRDLVAGVFDTIFVSPAAAGADNGDLDTLPEDAETLAARLADRGYREPKLSADRVLAVQRARRVAAASESSRRAIERLIARALDAVPRALAGAGVATVDPDQVLMRFLGLIEAIAGRSTYVALLCEYPQAFARVLRLLAASRWAADYLSTHPILLDELLDERVAGTDAEYDWPAWGADLAAQIEHAHDDPEREMNVLRDAHHTQVFRMLLADLDGRLTVERLADHLSAAADVVVSVALARAWHHLARRHRATPRFAVIGYGKLGGKELGYASDLDLIFLYDDDHADAAETYGLLARRLINWLTAQTSSGNLFDVDLRLRPDGAKGLLVSSFDAFAGYQRNEGASAQGLGAWTWEHQALTRARFVAGDAGIGAAFERLREQILARPRDLARLAEDVRQMRQRMLQGHPNRSELFDVKHDRGGMVDIEFVVQYLVLGHAGARPRLLGNLGNIALLKIAAELGLVEAGLAHAAADAYRRFRAIQHRLRLNGAEYARVPPGEVAAEVATVRELWASALGA
jgi:glutamate-ammonia-ligase adenylyltransferase